MRITSLPITRRRSAADLAASTPARRNGVKREAFWYCNFANSDRGQRKQLPSPPRASSKTDDRFCDG